jgi:hypothetical protein
MLNLKDIAEKWCEGCSDPHLDENKVADRRCGACLSNLSQLRQTLAMEKIAKNITLLAHPPYLIDCDNNIKKDTPCKK